MSLDSSLFLSVLFVLAVSLCVLFYSMLFSSVADHIVLTFTPLHVLLLAVLALIVVAVLQGIKMALSAGDQGATLTVCCLGCVGCCLFVLFVVVVVLVEVNTIEELQRNGTGSSSGGSGGSGTGRNAWAVMFVPFWILDVLFGSVTLIMFLNFICAPAQETDTPNPILWSNFICWCLFLLSIILTELLAVLLVGGRGTTHSQSLSIG